MTEETAADLTLADILAAAADEVDGVTAATAGDVTEWSAAGRPFVALAGDRAEFHLDPLVVRAALRTPDTMASPRGPDWIGFAPGVMDDPAVDRAEAWFLSAHRLVTAARH